MAKLTSASRASLKSSVFGEPGAREYPMPDKNHAAVAKGRAKQQLNQGHLSRDTYDTIVAKANRKLGE